MSLLNNIEISLYSVSQRRGAIFCKMKNVIVKEMSLSQVCMNTDTMPLAIS